MEDGFNLEEIDKAIVQAKAESDKPTIIEIKLQLVMVQKIKAHIKYMVVLLVKKSSTR